MIVVDVVLAWLSFCGGETCSWIEVESLKLVVYSCGRVMNKVEIEANVE